MTIQHNIDQMRLSLELWYNRATDEQIQEGELWYEVAGYTLEGLASIYGVPKYTVAGICAALSPQNHWLRNVRDTQRILFIHSTSIDPLTASTAILESKIHTRANLQKCVECLYSINPIVSHIRDTDKYLFSNCPNDVLRGNKVRSFYLNLMDETDCVTVDSWMHKAAIGVPPKDKLTNNLYNAIATAIRLNAYALKIEPSIYQATVWTVIRSSAIALP